MVHLYKYPRTKHLEGSGLQPGDEDLQVVPFTRVRGKYLVIEEKMDGANCGISFDITGKLRLQSRGHFLTGGVNERQFHLFKSWANTYKQKLWELLYDRYIMYGEWLYAKHTTFYTDLPHFFLEFDIYDRYTNQFLSTDKRMQILESFPFIHSVKVIKEGRFSSLNELKRLIGPSCFIAPDWKKTLHEVVIHEGLQEERILQETDLSGWMEGLYIKVEENGIVQERMKFIRSDFTQTIIHSGSHWMQRPILPNQLRKGVSIFDYS